MLAASTVADTALGSYATAFVQVVFVVSTTIAPRELVPKVKNKILSSLRWGRRTYGLSKSSKTPRCFKQETHVLENHWVGVCGEKAEVVTNTIATSSQKNAFYVETSML